MGLTLFSVPTIVRPPLLEAGLLATNPADHLTPYRAAYPVAFAPALFPGLYPAGKEIDMLNQS